MGEAIISRRGGGGKIKSIENAVVTLASSSFVYDGTEKTQQVTSVTLDGKTLVFGQDYIIIGDTATDAGAHQLSVLGILDYGGAATKTWNIAKASGSISVNPSAITITGSAGTTATAAITKRGDGAVSAQSSASGKATASVSGSTVTVTAVSEGSAVITVTLAEGVNYTGASCTINVTVQTAVVFGVMWNYGSSSSACTRLTASSDPNGYVTTSVSSEPTAAVGTSGGSSPFDNYMPWKGMVKYNANSAGDVSAWASNSNDTVVFIPEFWCKIIDDTSASKLYIYVSGTSFPGFTKHPGSGRYVARYATGSGYVSKTGLSPLVNMTRAAARSNSASKGTKWYQYDFASYSAICLLYIVEWADWNSQSKIGRGNVDTSSAIKTGGTDSMTYHTGRASGTDGATAVQYRWLENLWGNVYQWVDGINFSNRAAYICTDPTKFADDTDTNYTAAGVTLPSSYDYIKGMSPGSLGWGLIPDVSGGSSSTYVPDYVGSDSGWRVLNVGGLWSSASYAGLFCFDGYSSSSDAASPVGSRLLIIP